jgi:hypothetical protein
MALHASPLPSIIPFPVMAIFVAFFAEIGDWQRGIQSFETYIYQRIIIFIFTEDNHRTFLYMKIDIAFQDDRTGKPHSAGND